MKTKEVKELLGKIPFSSWVKDGTAERVFDRMKIYMIRLSKENKKLKKENKRFRSELITFVRKSQCRYNLECFNPENNEDCPELHCESKVAETIEKLKS